MAYIGFRVQGSSCKHEKVYGGRRQGGIRVQTNPCYVGDFSTRAVQMPRRRVKFLGR